VRWAYKARFPLFEMTMMERLRAAAERSRSEAADHSAALELVVAVAETM